MFVGVEDYEINCFYILYVRINFTSVLKDLDLGFLFILPSLVLFLRKSKTRIASNHFPFTVICFRQSRINFFLCCLFFDSFSKPCLSNVNFDMEFFCLVIIVPMSIESSSYQVFIKVYNAPWYYFLFLLECLKIVSCYY